MTLPLSAIALCLALGGCSADTGTGLNSAQTQMSANLNTWAKQTDGDWDKLSQDQKDTMIKSVGNEKSARMVLQMTAHKPTPVAPGPPPGVGQGGPHPTATTPPPNGAPPASTSK